ncbi:MAG: paraquat-inducible protein B [Kiritimatiellia bacterium]|jgi:paraquat-inducible protein B
MSEPENVSKPVIRKQRRISSVWIVPVVAAAMGGWLFYKSQAEAGIPITLHFTDGVGLTAHKTKIVFEGVPVGIVDEVHLKEDFDGIIVKATLDREAVKMARADSLFWLVRAEIGLGGITGLDTLISGNYISIRPGKGERAHTFTALTQAPGRDPDAPGLHIVLTTDQLNATASGTPLYYRKVQVGEIVGHELSENRDYIRIHAVIEPHYADLVRDNTRFWDVSGLKLKAGLEGVSIEAESLTALVAGGVAFDTPIYLAPGAEVSRGTEFHLYKDRESALKRGVPVSIHFETSEGLRKSASIRYKGLVIGEVTDLIISPTLDSVIANGLLDESARQIAVSNTVFWVVKPKLGLSGVSGLDTIVSGNYIEVLPGDGGASSSFVGLQQPPEEEAPADEANDPDFNLIVVADRRGSLKQGSPVFYRDIRVGQILRTELTPGADGVKIYASIRTRYAPLIRERTHFYNISGIGFDFSLFGGAKFKTGSMESVLEGGIAFATPERNGMGPRAAENSTFILFPEAEEEWHNWTPFIAYDDLQDEETVQVNQLSDSVLLKRNPNLRIHRQSLETEAPIPK